MTDREQATLYVERLFAGLEGFVALGVGFGGRFNGSGSYSFKSFAEDFFAWPDERARLLGRAFQYAPKEDVYVCPLLRATRSRKEGTGARGRYLWADLDKEAPAGWERLLGPSSFVIDSGRGRHPYIALPEPIAAAELQTLNQRLAKVLAADAGWSETKYLRLPGTLNHKMRAQGGAPARVEFLEIVTNARDLTLAELDGLLPDLPPPAANGAQPAATLPDNLPRQVAERLYKQAGKNRSAQTAGLVDACLQWGLEDAQILALGLEHPPTVEKYEGRIEKEINRLLGKRRPLHLHPGKPCNRAGCPNRPTWMTARRLVATPLTEITMRSIEWFEKPLWQLAAFQLVGGPKGSGKGTYLAGLAARFTSAGHTAMFVVSEDSAEIDLKPRLVAAGIDETRCRVIRQHVRLPDDVDELRELATEIGGVGLFVIDPVANHIGDRNSNSDAEVRDAIAPLNKLADELDCLLIGVRHPGKDRSRGAVASILGSTAWVDTPRAVVMLAADDEDPQVRHIQVVAGNRSLNGAAQAFRIEAVDVPGLTEPITLAVDLGESSKSVDALLEIRKVADTKSGKARDLLLDILDEEGDQESDALDAHVARETGLSARTVRDLRKALSNEGLIKASPDKAETGAVLRWRVSRTKAPR